MKQIYLLLSFSFLLLTSCNRRIVYLGQESSPVTHVDVFVDAAAIKRPYTIVGKGYAESPSLRKVQSKAMALARQKGADAILFQEYFLLQEGTNLHSVVKTDSSSRGLTTVTSTAVRPVVSEQRDILFLKYN